MNQENSPNGFTINRFDGNEPDKIEIKGSNFDNPDQYYPDYEKSKQANIVESTWEEDTKKSQKKLEDLKKQEESKGTIINQDDNVIDPNSFFNSSQNYVLFNLGDTLKERK